MAQRELMRREFIVRDASGNITTIADDLAVDVLLGGATIRSASGTIPNGSSTLEVYHPGRLDTNHWVFVQDKDSGALSAASIQITVRAVNASRHWELTVNNTGAGIAFNQGDRLIMDPTSSTREPRAAIYKDDTSSTDFWLNSEFIDGSSPGADGVPTSPMIVPTATGVMEFYTPENEIDLKLVKASDSGATVYGYKRDTGVGGERQFINGKSWIGGNVDAWPGLMTAILHAEDDANNKTVIHLPAGIYLLSGPLTITQPNVEIWLDADALLTHDGSWGTGRAIVEVAAAATGFVFRGGKMIPPGSNYGIQTLADESQVLHTRITGGQRGIYASGADRLSVLGCFVQGQEDYGLLLNDCDQYSLQADRFLSVGNGVNDADIRITRTAANSDSGTVVGCNSWLSAGMFLNIEGDSATPSTTGARKVSVASNEVNGASGAGMLLKACGNVSLNGNTVTDCSGNGIHITYAADINVDGNVVTNAGDIGFKVDGIGANYCDRVSLTNNHANGCTNEGMDVKDVDAGKVDHNTVLNNGAGNDIDIGGTFTNGTILGNTIGVGKLGISASATYEIGHNREV